ncbi:ATP-binding protein [Actinopolymorpha singaporensis]|uniref:ATPase family associated with various cellular activities (AAA) n=1 Tax=Actinopolymorpha singaporensis TaxID=117157 RepID=A0A1H1UZ87_9ACTN|nr:ATP-binding protein [Actinopolymorpha singaporensis]SDS77832.1 ATPase family associated with various cellular activities (AAA) [Actinopolymorpha singaporensis]
MSDLSSMPVRAGHLVERLADLADEPLRPALAGLAAALRSEKDAGAAGRLGAALGLTPFQYDLLLLAGLPEEHEAVSRLARLLNSTAEPWFTSATASAVLGLDTAGRGHLRTALDSGTLHRHRLVTGPESVPLPERGLRLPPGVWSVLRGVDTWPAGMHPIGLPVLPGPQLPGLAPALGSTSTSAFATTLAATLAAAEPGRHPGEPRVVVLSGEGRDDREVAALAAATVRAPTVIVPAAELDAERTPAWSAHLLARGAVPVVAGAPSSPPLPAFPGVVVVATGTVTGMPLDDRPAVTVELPRPDLGEAVELWQALLPDLNGAAGELAGLLRIGRIGATRAVRDARAAGDVTVGRIVAQARRRTEVELPAAVRLVHPHASLDRVVLPADQHRLLRSVVDRVRGQARVLLEWGFGEAARHPGGVRMLLSGPPGTGKTLAVEAAAAELGLDLLVVDLAALVSKWLGETEKNIAGVFDAAERSQAVLFFDEADAVFGRRTDSSDAQGRWANLETAYLLARIDRFDGLVALATNLRRGMDDAFVRRLDVILEIDEPDRTSRELLWRRHLPAGAPYAADVDPAALAALYEIPGGLIRNAALAAAFVAAATGRPIDQSALVEAVRDEYRKAGRSFPGAPRTTARGRGGL